MTLTSQKLELIQWITNLDNARLLKEIAEIRNRTTSQNIEPKRFFGCGKDIVLEIAEDFNEFFGKNFISVIPFSLHNFSKSLH